MRYQICFSFESEQEVSAQTVFNNLPEFFQKSDEVSLKSLKTEFKTVKLEENSNKLKINWNLKRRYQKNTQDIIDYFVLRYPSNVRLSDLFDTFPARKVPALRAAIARLTIKGYLKMIKRSVYILDPDTR